MLARFFPRKDLLALNDRFSSVVCAIQRHYVVHPLLQEIRQRVPNYMSLKYVWNCCVSQNEMY